MGRVALIQNDIDVQLDGIGSSYGNGILVQQSLMLEEYGFSFATRDL